MSKAKLIIIITVFIDVLGIGLVAPILPVYVENLTHSGFLAAALFSVFSFFGFFAAPLLGGISDRYGRRPVLILSLLGTSIGWFLFAWGGSLLFLVLGRIIDGITSGNIATAQSYLIDISKDEKERTANLGVIGATFGIGFIIGPGLGALLSTHSMSLPFWMAMGLALANAISAYFFLPESNLHKDPSRKLSMNPFRGLKKAFASPGIAYLLVIWFLYTMSFGSMQTIFSLFTHLAYHISASWNGWLLAMIGVVQAFNQGFLLKRFWLKRFKQRSLEIGAAATAFMAYGMILTQNFSLFLIAIVLMSFANALIRVINTSEISGSVKKEERGEIVGVIQSVMFLSAILSPLLGGVAITQHVFAPWGLCAGYMAIALVLLLLRHRKTMRVNVAISKELPL